MARLRLLLLLLLLLLLHSCAGESVLLLTRDRAVADSPRAGGLETPTVSSLPPALCDLNVAYTAVSGLDEWPNALATLDVVSFSSNLSSWVLVWVLSDAETLQGPSVSGALLINPGGGASLSAPKHHVHPLSPQLQ